MVVSALMSAVTQKSVSVSTDLWWHELSEWGDIFVFEDVFEINLSDL